MDQPLTLLALVVTALAALALMCATALRGWTEWLALKRLELTAGRPAPSPAAARIELAALRDRVRKLEAIASGIDL